jgi:hypothetical protein
MPRTDEDFYNLLKTNLPSVKSSQNYIARLKKIMTFPEVKEAGATLKKVLKHPDVFYPVVQNHYPNINTRKNVMTAIMAVFKFDKDYAARHEDAFREWKRLHENMTSLQEVKVKQNEPSERQKANYTSFEDIKLKHIEVKKSGDPHATLKTSQQYLLLTILLDITPKRSDLGRLRIYKDRDPNNSKENYLVLKNKFDTDASYLVLNKYKTAKTYGRVEEDIADATAVILRESLRRHPREYVFVDKHGVPYSTNDAYGKFVVRTFMDLFGKQMGTSLIRHAFVKEKVDPKSMSQEELEEIALKMLHSTKLQAQYNFVEKQAKGNQVCVCLDKKDLKRVAQALGKHDLDIVQK